MISSERYSFFRTAGSFFMWCWLAMIIRGRSHTVRFTSGDDRESEKKFVEKLWLLMSSLLRVGREISAMSKLWQEVLIHNSEFFDSQVTGMSMIVGRIIFSIVGGLSFVRNLSRRCLIPGLVRPDLWLLRKRRILGELGGWCMIGCSGSLV